MSVELGLSVRFKPHSHPSWRKIYRAQLIQNKGYQAVLAIKNIGDEPYHGGSIGSVSFRNVFSGDNINAATINSSIPELVPGEIEYIPLCDLKLVQHGTWKVHINLTHPQRVDYIYPFIEWPDIIDKKYMQDHQVPTASFFSERIWSREEYEVRASSSAKMMMLMALLSLIATIGSCFGSTLYPIMTN